jgi:class 3 adenylate cyclase/tetratricopeptide (TPR) repeat protein
VNEGAAGGDRAPDGSGALLRPYVADLQAEWLALEGPPRWRPIDGTLLFADVSGFTPLTERLATRGRIGSEALIDVLNEVFDALLTVAASDGGDLLKFGGDALLLLFRGEGSATRAATVAAGMQRALARWRRFRTDAGVMSLRMSAGIASGTVDTFLVGDSHRELVVGGAVVTRVVACEAAAAPGETVVDRETAKALDARYLGPAKGPGTVLRRGPSSHVPSAALPERAKVDAGDVARAIPTSLRLHLSARADDGEHRQAVLAFIRFTGVDRLLEVEGPDAVAAALDEVVQATQRACDSHGVTFLATDVDAGGGKILLVAGAPIASTDDADRMLTALLDVVAVSTALSVHAGVNAGPAFAVDVGSATRRTYAVMGDATNLAARVAGRAPAGGLVATAAVLARARADYELVHLEPFAVKGKSQPVSAAVVVGVSSRRDDTSDGATRLYGRGVEMDALARLLGAARAGRGGVVELVGEAGIGKSSIVSATRRAAPAVPAFVLAAAPYASASPYFAFRTPLRAALGMAATPAEDDEARLTAGLERQAPAVMPWAPLIGVVLGIEMADTVETADLDPEFRRQRAHDAVRDLLASALPGPAMVIVEDAHWLDEASAALLVDVLADVATRPWAVVVTRRPSGGGLRLPDDGTDRIELEPLDPGAAVELARAEREDLPPHVREHLAERSAGNPLFLVELLASITSTTVMDALPDTVESVVGARIDALPPAARSLLRDASVLGQRFSSELVAGVTRRAPADVDATLESLRGFVVRSDRDWMFGHDLVRAVAYATLPFRRRRGLHASAASLIEARAGDGVAEWADLLSLHYSEAQQHAQTWRYGRVAGERARERWAPADAQVFYRRALAAARHLPLDSGEVASVWEALGDAAELSGRYTDAAVAYGRARALRRAEPLRVADLCRKEGWVRERSGRYAEALAWYSRGARLVREADLSDEDTARMGAQLALASGAARLRQGKYRQGLPSLHEAVTLATRLEDKATLAHAYYLLDWAYTDLGDDKALEYRELSAPIYEELDNRSRLGVVYSNLGIDAYFEGRWDEAIELYERGRDASRRAGDVVQAATAANNIGEVRSDQGRLDEAETLFRDALATWRAAPFPVGVSLALSNLGRVATRAGRFEEGAELYQQARAGFTTIGAKGYVVEVDAREAERLMLAGRFTEALRGVARTSADAHQVGGMPNVMVLLRRIEGQATARLGDVHLARRLLEDAVAQAEAPTHLYERALTLDALGQLLPRDEGMALRASAGAILEKLGVVHPPIIDIFTPHRRR